MSATTLTAKAAKKTTAKKAPKAKGPPAPGRFTFWLDKKLTEASGRYEAALASSEGFPAIRSVVEAWSPMHLETARLDAAHSALEEEADVDGAALDAANDAWMNMLGSAEEVSSSVLDLPASTAREAQAKIDSLYAMQGCKVRSEIYDDGTGNLVIAAMRRDLDHLATMGSLDVRPTTAAWDAALSAWQALEDSNDVSDAGLDARAEADCALIQTPAPDAAALLVKLEHGVEMLMDGRERLDLDLAQKWLQDGDWMKKCLGAVYLDLLNLDGSVTAKIRSEPGDTAIKSLHQRRRDLEKEYEASDADEHTERVASDLAEIDRAILAMPCTSAEIGQAKLAEVLKSFAAGEIGGEEAALREVIDWLGDRQAIAASDCPVAALVPKVEFHLKAELEAVDVAFEARQAGDDEAADAADQENDKHFSARDKILMGVADAVPTSRLGATLQMLFAVTEIEVMRSEMDQETRDDCHLRIEKLMKSALNVLAEPVPEFLWTAFLGGEQKRPAAPGATPDDLALIALDIELADLLPQILAKNDEIADAVEAACDQALAELGADASPSALFARRGEIEAENGISAITDAIKPMQDRLGEIERQQLGHRATTIAGLRPKARLAAYWRSFDPDTSEIDSLIRDAAILCGLSVDGLSDGPRDLFDEYEFLGGKITALESPISQRAWIGVKLAPPSTRATEIERQINGEVLKELHAIALDAYGKQVWASDDDLIKVNTRGAK